MDQGHPIERAWAQGGRRVGLLPEDRQVTIGLEERGPRDGYDWHGMQRGADPRRPHVVVQHTLSGWGCYEDRTGRRRVDPGHLLVAVIPSDHRYWLPAESARWRFFYAMLWHPFAVDLLRRGVESHGGVVAAPMGSPLMTAAVRLFAGIRLGSFSDPLAEEQAVVELGFAHARRLRELHPDGDPRSRLLAQVDGYLRAHPGRFVDVAELAAAAGSTRSAWSHRFAALTGLTPARYVVQVRLDEVRRALVETTDPLAVIAARLGFADANHLGKVFRRHFHCSPGQWRRRMNGA